ncbi:MAG: hypothetical protein F6J93_16315 [Oscillatoria sp. SIO1A7]|nr:hypothetical protein [Oscillatoria sp. SIO1A7]
MQSNGGDRGTFLPRSLNRKRDFEPGSPLKKTHPLPLHGHTDGRRHFGVGYIPAG